MGRRVHNRNEERTAILPFGAAVIVAVDETIDTVNILPLQLALPIAVAAYLIYV
jgi:hypothetical protein